MPRNYLNEEGYLRVSKIKFLITKIILLLGEILLVVWITENLTCEK